MATALEKSHILTIQDQQNDALTHMAQRLSADTPLDVFFVPDRPEWRIHDFFTDLVLFARDYHAALNYGDPSGSAYDGVARPRQDPQAALATLTPAARAAVQRELATLDLADSALIAGTDQTGHLRYGGRQELEAIDALEADVIDPSTDQSATAVLDKISGATLIETRQHQARLQFLAAVVEQLLVDNKRARDTETATMNMQLEQLRGGRAVQDRLILGAGDDLRTWRQP